jgi:hypothetical protein
VLLNCVCGARANDNLQAERAIEAWLTGTLRTKRDDNFPSFDLANWGTPTTAYFSSTKKLKKLNWKHIFSRAVDFHNLAHAKSKLGTTQEDHADPAVAHDPRASLMLEDDLSDDDTRGKPSWSHDGALDDLVHSLNLLL